MNPLRRSLALLALTASVASIAPRAIARVPALLAWGDVQVLLFPDSADGTLIALGQLYRGTRPDRPVGFSAFFDPDSAGAWIPVVRTFLRREMPASDTNRVAVSAPLVSPDGEVLFFARRRSDSGWTPDRYVGLRTRWDRAVEYINLPQRAAETFLDSLGAVVLRTSVFVNPSEHWPIPAWRIRDTLDCPIPLPGNRAPHYPVGERNSNVEGQVWTSFVITEGGTVDANSIQVLFATREAFGRAVLNAVPRLRFDPARHNGVAFSQRVVVPFFFQLTRPGEAWPSDAPHQSKHRCG